MKRIFHFSKLIKQYFKLTYDNLNIIPYSSQFATLDYKEDITILQNGQDNRIDSNAFKFSPYHF